MPRLGTSVGFPLPLAHFEWLLTNDKGSDLFAWPSHIQTNRAASGSDGDSGGPSGTPSLLRSIYIHRSHQALRSSKPQ